MLSFYSIFTFLPLLCWAATIRTPPPQITEPPNPLLARELVITKRSNSCSLVDVPAFSTHGESFPASKGCNCDGGVEAGASSTIGSDGATTWNCAQGFTPLPISTEPPAPTWTIEVKVGHNMFMAGDYKQSNFVGLMNSMCDSTGCDGGDPETFTFNWTEPSNFALTAHGTLSMSGILNGTQSYDTSLITAINSALLASSNCTTVPTLFPENTPWRRSVGPAPVYQTIDLPQCHLVDWLEAEIYDEEAAAKGFPLGGYTMSAQSSNPIAIECEEIIGAINDALTILTLPGYITGGVTVAQALCAASG